MNASEKRTKISWDGQSLPPKKTWKKPDKLYLAISFCVPCTAIKVHHWCLSCCEEDRANSALNETLWPETCKTGESKPSLATILFNLDITDATLVFLLSLFLLLRGTKLFLYYLTPRYLLLSSEKSFHGTMRFCRSYKVIEVWSSHHHLWQLLPCQNSYTSNLKYRKQSSPYCPRRSLSPSVTDNLSADTAPSHHRPLTANVKSFRQQKNTSSKSRQTTLTT